MSKIFDLIGKKFGRWTVIELHDVIQRYTKNGVKDGKDYYYLCQCECGNTSVVYRGNLLKGLSKSCGCLAEEKRIKTNTKHKLSHSRIDRIYYGMKARCYNSNNPAYKNYGQRGITICNEWLNDKNKFFEWAINNGYKDNLTIDRIDNNKGYSSNNCRWVTKKEQQNNKRNNCLITFNNETHTLSQWANILNVKISKLRYILFK